MSKPASAQTTSPGVVWHLASETPPRSRAPYHSYLVWLRAPTGPICGGVARVVQFSRDRQLWMSEQMEGNFGPLIVTHWAEVPRPKEAGEEFPWREECDANVSF